MNDPLKRRMFAQQVMNMYNSRQPMGILASSPELMGAVKGYRVGGVQQRPNITIEELEQLNKGAVTASPALIQNKYGNVVFDRNTQKYKIVPVDMEGGASGTGSLPSGDVFKQQEKDIIQGKDLPTIEKEIKDQLQIEKEKAEKEKTNVPQVDEFGEDKKFPENVEGGTPSAKINEVNKDIIEKKPEDEKFPEGKNLGADRKKSGFLTDVANSYEAFKDKLAKIDRRYEVDEAKRTNYMQKIESLMEEEEDEINLEDVDKKAREVLDLKEGQYDDDRVTAFWMSMIKGGLATAAGESGNALTNISKGLLFGVESFGKDLNQINQQEREDRKSLAKIRYDLMKDEKAAKIAERTLKIQAYGELAKLEENKFQFKTELEYKTARNKITDELAFAKLDLTAAQTLQSMELAGKTFDLKVEELALNKRKQDDYVRLTEKQLSAQLKDKASTKEIKNIYALGSDYATYEDGKFTFTKKGRAMLIAATSSKTKFTDLVTTAKAVGANKTIEGYKYETSDKAEQAYYYYEGVIKPQLKKLDDLSKKATGSIDAATYDKRKNDLMKQFAEDTGAIKSPTGGANVAPTAFDSRPDDATIKTLINQGFNAIKIGNQTFNISSN
jgi:hypothetical protein